MLSRRGLELIDRVQDLQVKLQKNVSNVLAIASLELVLTFLLILIQQQFVLSAQLPDFCSGI